MWWVTLTGSHFFFVITSLIKNIIFPKLKILDIKCPEYVQIVAWALKEGFGITNELFLLDCNDTAMKVITREHSKQLAYVNKRFRMKLRECEPICQCCGCICCCCHCH